jgi:sugar phosphate isomerase/epimerase
VKLGLLTSAFPGLNLEQVAGWAAGAGFQSLEIAAWPPEGGARRRYAGVSHLDVGRLGDAEARGVRELLEGHGLEISALAYYPNPLDPDPGVRRAVVDHLKQVILAAERLGVDTVGTFVGRDQSAPVSRNLTAFEEQWPPLVAFAGEHGVRIAIENCPMIFSEDEWPGGRNLAYSPALWRHLFEVLPAPNFGLNFDPSHLIWQFIDVERAVREFAPRIFHVHAKDMEVDRDGLYEQGVMSLGMGWQVPRLPGLGQVAWGRFIAALYRGGYDGFISIEHEDRAFEGDLELVQRGFLLARDVLRPLIV